MSFLASAVGFERDPERNAQYLILAAHRDGSGRRLEIQRSLEVDEQDRALGMGQVKAINSPLDAAVNDVVMAVCAGALRTWLDRRGALPDEPLVALIPVSMRTGEETHRWTNRVSMPSAVLPTDEPDPIQRVGRVHDCMASSKELFRALPAERLTDFAEFPPPAVFARAMRLSARLRLGSRLTPGNLVISNVPGPRTPLYAAGARLEHYYPVSTIVEGAGTQRHGAELWTASTGAWSRARSSCRTSICCWTTSWKTSRRSRPRPGPRRRSAPPGTPPAGGARRRAHGRRRGLTPPPDGVSEPMSARTQARCRVGDMAPRFTAQTSRPSGLPA